MFNIIIDFKDIKKIVISREKVLANTVDYELSNRLKGKILLQVESRGEAWYVNPENGKRYYMGKPRDAFELMRKLGLGITNENLRKIDVGEL